MQKQEKTALEDIRRIVESVSTDRTFGSSSRAMDDAVVGCCAVLTSQARILEGVALPSPGDLPRLGIEPSSLLWQVDSFTTEPGKLKAYTMGCLVGTETPHQVEEVNYIMTRL